MKSAAVEFLTKTCSGKRLRFWRQNGFGAGTPGSANWPSSRSERKTSSFCYP
jgi:hypothetical protein